MRGLNYPYVTGRSATPGGVRGQCNGRGGVEKEVVLLLLPRGLALALTCTQATEVGESQGAPSPLLLLLSSG